MKQATCTMPRCPVLVRPGAELCAMHLMQNKIARRRRLAEIEAAAEGQTLCHSPNCTELASPLGGGRLCSRHLADVLPTTPKRPKRLISPVGQYRIVAHRGRKVGEHRVVMERHIGRPLVDAENVHHINGVKNDNRIENLELWSTSQPCGQRIEDKVAHAIEILRLYRPEALA